MVCQGRNPFFLRSEFLLEKGVRRGYTWAESRNPFFLRSEFLQLKKAEAWVVANPSQSLFLKV